MKTEDKFRIKSASKKTGQGKIFNYSLQRKNFIQ